MQFDHILFDLDGTLTNPALGITNSVAYALEKFGIHIEDRRQLYPFIGPPLIDSFMEYYGFTKEDALKGVAYYREYYAEKGIFECVVYEGIPQLLDRLSCSGEKLLLATSKPEVFAKKVLEHFGIAQYFYRITGASLDQTRTRKDQVIALALQDLPIQRTRAAMVGDRKYDMEGAKQFGLYAIGVLFGYGSRAELELAGADQLVADVSQLEHILLA